MLYGNHWYICYFMYELILDSLVIFVKSFFYPTVTSGASYLFFLALPPISKIGVIIPVAQTVVKNEMR